MRKSGIELLRILAASAVVILHYHSISSGMGVEGTNKIVLELLVSFAICAVNVFVAISGFFMIKSQKRTWGKILSLLFQVSLINVGILMPLGFLHLGCHYRFHILQLQILKYERLQLMLLVIIHFRFLTFLVCL